MVKKETRSILDTPFKQAETGCCIGQVIFDSSDYAFAPDILFDPNAPLISNDDARLLPIAWHIGDSACLHDWLQFVRQKVTYIIVWSTKKRELQLIWGMLFMQIFNIPPEINTQQDTTSDDLMEVDGEKRSPHLDETTSASVVVNETEAKTSTVAAEEADMVVDLPEVRLKRRYQKSWILKIALGEARANTNIITITT